MSVTDKISNRTQDSETSRPQSDRAKMNASVFSTSSVSVLYLIPFIRTPRKLVPTSEAYVNSEVDRANAYNIIYVGDWNIATLDRRHLAKVHFCRVSFL